MGPDRIATLVGPLRDAWQGRPQPGPDADAPIALGIWWGLVERCEIDARTACLTVTDETLASAGVTRPPSSIWGDTSAELRATGYRIGLDLLGAPGGGGVPSQLPAWAVAP